MTVAQRSTVLVLSLSVGVGGTVHILGDGLNKSMASQFLSKDIGINELNPKFY